MFSYRYAQRALLSSERIPELPPNNADRGEAELRVDFYETMLCPGQWASKGEPTTRFDDDALIIRFDDHAEFRISPNNDRVECRYRQGADGEHVRHLLLDHVLPRTLAESGMFVLHASGVAYDDGVILFVGASGFGKSTLAASLADTGFPLIGDDCFVVDASGDRIRAVSSYPSLRLLPASAGRLLPRPAIEIAPVGPHRPKHRVSGVAVSPDAAPTRLRSVFSIVAPSDSPSGDPASSPLSQRDATLCLMRNSFRVNLGPAGLVPALEVAQRIAQSVGVKSLTYERRFDQLPRLVDLIVASAQASS